MNELSKFSSRLLILNILSEFWIGPNLNPNIEIWLFKMMDTKIVLVGSLIVNFECCNSFSNQLLIWAIRILTSHLSSQNPNFIRKIKIVIINIDLKIILASNIIELLSKISDRNNWLEEIRLFCLSWRVWQKTTWNGWKLIWSEQVKQFSK